MQCRRWVERVWKYKHRKTSPSAAAAALAAATPKRTTTVAMRNNGCIKCSPRNTCLVVYAAAVCFFYHDLKKRK